MFNLYLCGWVYYKRWTCDLWSVLTRQESHQEHKEKCIERLMSLWDLVSKHPMLDIFKVDFISKTFSFSLCTFHLNFNKRMHFKIVICKSRKIQNQYLYSIQYVYIKSLYIMYICKIWFFDTKYFKNFAWAQYINTKIIN